MTRSSSHLARLALLSVFLVASTASADDPGELGTYEQKALTRALADRGLELEPSPEGKVLDEIHVVNLPVFGEDSGILQVFNVFHFTTREYVIRREVLLRPGEEWDQEVVEETERELKDPLFTALVVVVPVTSPEPGKFDLLVVTRDIWSLRLNTAFEFQQGTLTQLSVAPSENNVFGFRKQAAFIFAMDQGSYSLGPHYTDKNIAGTRLQFLGQGRLIFSREDGELEGTRSTLQLAYPLWSLDREWGGSLQFSHFDSRVRFFRGNDLRRYDNPDTFEVEAIPWQYDHRVVTLVSSVVRQFGEDVKHRVTVGHDFDVRRPEVVDDFVGDDGLVNPTRERVERAREAFIRDALPRSERSSAGFVQYRLFTPEFIVYRDLDTFDLPEDTRLGPELTLRASSALELIGSEENFSLLSATGGWTFDVRQDGLVRVGASASGRVEGGELIDKTYSGSLRVAAPRVADLFRVVGRTSLAVRQDEEGNRFFTLGGASGLRGYQIGAFNSTANAELQVRSISNLELRTMPVRILFMEVGAVLFWDAGHAADGFDDLSIHHDVGAGLRVLIPHAQPFVFRLDQAVPLTGPTAGLPGRFSAGIEQVF